MLEGVLAALLERIAGKYVDGIDKKAAKLSVWSGHVILKNLALKRSALDDLDLPFKLKYGRLEEMSLEIPWKNLRNQPIVVHLTGLYIILSPNVSSSVSAAEMKSKLLSSKRAMVAELDSQDINGAARIQGEEISSSFTSRLITKIVDNMQLKISNVHIRYEDQYADVDHPFALGIMLQCFSAESTDTDWRPCFVENQKVLHKAATLQGLSLYLNSDIGVQAGDPASSPGNTRTAAVEDKLALITLVKAESCLSKERPGTGDLFVELAVEHDVRRSKAVEKSANPEWDEDFEIVFPSLDSVLVVTLYSQEKGMLFGRSETCLGSISIPFKDIASSRKNVQQWFDLGEHAASSKDSEADTGTMWRILLTLVPPSQARNDANDAWRKSLLGSNFASDMVRMVQYHDLEVNPNESQNASSFDGLADPSSPSRPCFVVKPIDAALRLKINKSDIPDARVPKYDAVLEMARVSLRLSRRQYRDILRTMDFLGNHERIIRYAQFRPNTPIRETPRAWWQFAIQCAVWEREQTNKRFDRRAVFRIIAKWPKYASLYRRRFASTLQLASLDPVECAMLKDLEDELPFEAIAAAREAIHRELRKHAEIEKLRVEHQKQQQQQQQQQQQASQAGFYGGLRGWFGFQAHGDSGSRGEAEELRSSLKDLLTEFGIADGPESTGHDATGGCATTSPDAASTATNDADSALFTRVRLEFILRYGSCTVTNNLEDGNVEFPIVMLRYRDLRTEVVLRPFSSDIEVHLGDFLISDLFSKNLCTGFNRIVTRYNSGSARQQSIYASPSWAQTTGKAKHPGVNWGFVRYLSSDWKGVNRRRLYSVDEKIDEGEKTALLWVKYQSRPPDGQADSRLIFRLDRMTLVYNTSVLRALNDFLDVGASPTLELIARAGKEQMEETRKRSQQNLNLALSNKLVFDMCIDLQSPVIIIPQGVNAFDEKDSVMIFQPGNLSVWSMSSHLHETSQLLQSMVKLDTTDDRYYNTLLLEITDVSVAVCNRAECWSVSAEPVNAKNGLIQDIRVSICIQNSIAPTNIDLTRTKMKVALPVLNLNFSRRKYAMLLDVLSSFSSSDDSAGSTKAEDSTSDVKGSDPAEMAEAVVSGPDSPEMGDDLGPTSWRLLDILVSVAPRSAGAEVRLHLSDEDATPPVPIADLTIQEVAASYISFAGGSTKLKVSVGSLVIYDSRPTSDNKFRRLLAPKTAESDPDNENDILEFEMQTHPIGHTDYILRLVHLNVSLVPMAILPILHVFQSPAPKPSSQNAEQISQDPAVRGPRVALTQEAEQICAVATYHIFLQSPSICVIEDESDPESRRLRFEASLMLKHSQLSDLSTCGQIHLQDFLLKIKDDRNDERILMSKAVSMSVEYAIHTDGGTKAVLLSSEAELQMTYQDIKLILNVWQRLILEFRGESSAPPVIEQDDTKATGPSDDSGAATAPTLSQQDYSLSFGLLRVIVFNDCKGFSQPFMDVALRSMCAGYTQSEGGKSGWGLQARMQLSLYNIEVMNFEPVIEDWGFSVQYSRKPGDIGSTDSSPTKDPKMKSENDGLSGCSALETYSLLSTELLNLNVMEAHILNASRTLSAWQADFYGNTQGPIQDAKTGEHAYCVKNRCGVALNVRDFWVTAQSSVVVVAPAAIEPVLFFDGSQNIEEGKDVFDRDQHLQVEKSRLLHVSAGSVSNSSDENSGFPLPLDADNVRKLSLPDQGEVLVLISTDEGTSQRLVTVQSRYSLENVTNEDFQVQFAISSEINSGEIMSVPAKSLCDLAPRALCNRHPEDIAIAVRPILGGEHSSGVLPGWSEFLTVTSGLDIVVTTDATGELRAVDDSDDSFAVDQDIFYTRIVARMSNVKLSDGGEFDLVTIVLMPVISISNLLPCPMRFSFWIEGMDQPLPALIANSGEDVAVHSVGLSRRINIGIAIDGLDDGSEFVPIFSPDGSALESHIVLYDSAKDYVRLQLLHAQEAQQMFSLKVFAPYWLVNRTGFPITIAQKWTASSVTIIGGQQHADQEWYGTGNVGYSLSDADTILTGSCPEAFPRIFSFGSKIDLGGSKACVRLGKPFGRFSSREGRQVPCEWSRPFYIDAIGSSGELELVGEEFVVDITFHVSSGEGIYRRTKILTLLPRYVVCNMLQRNVLVGQMGCEDVAPVSLRHRGVQVVRWLHESSDRRLKFRLAANAEVDPQGLDWYWTEAIPVCHIGYSPLKMRSSQAVIFNTMIQSSLQDSVTVIALREYDLENPALKIVNRSSWATIYYRQAGVDRCLEERADPGQELGFCWDNPHSASHTLVVRVRCGREVHTIDCDLDRLGLFPDLTVDGRTLRISIEAQGPTKILAITDARIDHDWEILSVLKARPKEPGCVAGAQTGLQIQVQLAGVGISIIDHAPQELLYATICGIAYRAVTLETWHLLDLRVQRIQIDNQTSHGNPVLLCAAGAAVNASHSGRQAAAAPVEGSGVADSAAAPEAAAAADGSTHSDDHLLVRISQSLTNPSVDSFELVEAAVSDLALDLDEYLLVALLAAFRGLLSSTSSAAAPEPEVDLGAVGAVDLSPVTAHASAAGRRWVYIESLRVSALRLYVTFHGSDDAHGLLHSKAISRLPMFAFVEAVKALVTNIDRAPIILAPIDWGRPFLPREDLIGRVAKHYRHCLLKGFYRLVGSFEFLGNPTGLVSNIGAGLHGAVEASREGMKEGRLGRGLARGAGTLAAGTVQGVFGSAAGLSGAMGKGLAQLSFDGNYKRARALLDRSRPTNLGQGVWQGGRSFGQGIVQGVTGIVTQPVRGYTKEGARGAVKGFGKGLVGVVVKPVAGLADLVAQTSEGIRNTPEYMLRHATNAAAAAVRVRLPRRWEGGRAVTKFDGARALAAAILMHLAQEQGWPRDETPLDYIRWKESRSGSGVGPSGAVCWIILTGARLVVCEQCGPVRGHDGLLVTRLISAVPIDSILQVREAADGVYVLGLEVGAGVVTRCALRCGALLRLSASGSAAGDRSGRRVGLRDGRVVYGLRLCLPDKTLRTWVVTRLRRLTSSDSSRLIGEDWSLVDPPRPVRGPVATGSGGGDNGSGEPVGDCDSMEAAIGPSPPLEASPVVGHDGPDGHDDLWRVLSEMTVRVTGAVIRNQNQREEHCAYAIFCRSSCVGGSAASAAHCEQSGDGWMVYRRFKEFRSLREELCGALAHSRYVADQSAHGGWRWVIPALPPRRLFGSTSPEVVQERSWPLDAFLVRLLDICCGRDGSGGGRSRRPPDSFVKAVARFLECGPAADGVPADVLG